jgi:putative transcriptional regulator
MSDELFTELMHSVREGGAILRGEKEPSRCFEIAAPDVKQIRERYELSQSEFAALLGVSVKTLQNWEQHRRNPTGPAAALLKIVRTAPDVALKTLHT